MFSSWLSFVPRTWLGIKKLLSKRVPCLRSVCISFIRVVFSAMFFPGGSLSLELRSNLGLGRFPLEQRAILVPPSLRIPFSFWALSLALRYFFFHWVGSLFLARLAC